MNDDGVVTHARTQIPQPTQAAPITGRPASSKSSAAAPTGQTRAQTPHSIPWNAMHRPASSDSRPIRSVAQPSTGGISASVGQTVAQNMPSHAMHGCTSGSMIGVAAASPALAGALTIASTGQASTQ